MADKIEPLQTNQFGLAAHRYQTLSATVREGTTKEMLLNPLFWANVRGKVRAHDEIRVVAEDSSFMALVLVAYADQFQVLPKIIWYVDMEVTDPTELGKGQERYIIKARGSLGICLVDTETDKNIKTKLQSMSIAHRELEEHLRAIAS